MRTPDYFDAVPPLVMQDPLAGFLGATEDGLIEYRFADVVKLAGHACPTVAGAWLMTASALRSLYPDGIPQRGDIEVTLRGELDEGVAGVIGAVVGMITGAAGEGGFKGIGGRFVRQGLLRFGVSMEGEVRYRRTDTGASVEMAFRPDSVPLPAEVRTLLRAALDPAAPVAVQRAFADGWQGRVRALLLEHADDPAIVVRIA